MKQIYVYFMRYLRCNIINVLHVEDGDYFLFLFARWQLLQKICDSFWVMGKHASNWRRHVTALTFHPLTP